MAYRHGISVKGHGAGGRCDVGSKRRFKVMPLISRWILI